jgi:hypothetical protein
MLNQVHLFRAMNAYLSVVFIVGLAQSLLLYLAIIRLVKKGPSRWPRLLRLVGKNALALVTPSLMFPLIASLLLTIGQCVASLFIWPSADGFTFGQLSFYYCLLLIPIGSVMLAFDFFRIMQGSGFDSSSLEPILDIAEKALHPGAVAIGKTLSFGRLDTVGIISIKIKKFLSAFDLSLRAGLWLIVITLTLRAIFTAILWFAFAYQ